MENAGLRTYRALDAASLMRAPFACHCHKTKSGYHSDAVERVLRWAPGGKGTPDGEIKRKLYIYMNPREIPLRWLSKGDKYGYPGWVDYFKLKKMVAAKKRG